MQYTDRFGSPLAVGDKIVVAVHSGRSSATMKDTTVAGLVPLIPFRNKPPRREHYDFKTNTYSGPIVGYYYMREDQQNKRNPTEFYRKADTPQDKLYVLQYQNYASYDAYNGAWKKGDPIRVQSFDRVMDVIKVSA
jgi:hypothetical protein